MSSHDRMSIDSTWLFPFNNLQLLLARPCCSTSGCLNWYLFLLPPTQFSLRPLVLKLLLTFKVPKKWVSTIHCTKHQRGLNPYRQHKLALDSFHYIGPDLLNFGDSTRNAHQAQNSGLPHQTEVNVPCRSSLSLSLSPSLPLSRVHTRSLFLA